MITNKDVMWFKSKRDFSLERFNDSVNRGDTEERTEERYRSLKRSQKNLRMMEDTLIIQKVIFEPHIDKIKKIING